MPKMMKPSSPHLLPSVTLSITAILLLTPVLFGSGEIDIGSQVRGARSAGKQVIVLFESHSCEWSRRLHAALNGDRATRLLVDRNFVLVRLDVKQFGEHLDLAARYGAMLQDDGVPYLVLLDTDGTVRARQSTTVLENSDGTHYVLGRVQYLLSNWARGQYPSLKEIARYQ